MKLPATAEDLLASRLEQVYYQRMGVGLDEAVGKLLDAPLWAKSDLDLATETSELLRVKDRIEALLSNNLAEVSNRGLTDPTGRILPSPAAWLQKVATAPIGLSAARKIARRTWTRRMLPTLAQLHEDGTISTAYLDAAGQRLEKLPADARTSIDEVLSGTASGCDPADVAALVKQVRAMINPDEHTDRAEHLDTLSRINISPVGNEGAYAVNGVLYGPDAERLHNQTHAAADRLRSDGDTRSPGERRAAALFGLCRIAERATGDSDYRPAPHGADVHVTIFATANAWNGDPGAPAARTAGGNLIDPATLAAIRCTTPTPDILIAAPNGTCEQCGGSGVTGGSEMDDTELLRRSLVGLVHPDASYRLQPLAYGRARRTASPAQWQALLARDHHCTLPGCTRGPTDLQAHHLREYDADHGRTDLHHLALLCWQHHTQLHQQGKHLHPPWCTCHPDSTNWTIATEAPELE